MNENMSEMNYPIVYSIMPIVGPDLYNEYQTTTYYYIVSKAFLINTTISINYNPYEEKIQYNIVYPYPDPHIKGYQDITYPNKNAEYVSTNQIFPTFEDALAVAEKENQNIYKNLYTKEVAQILETYKNNALIYENIINELTNSLMVTPQENLSFSLKKKNTN